MENFKGVHLFKRNHACLNASLALQRNIYSWDGHRPESEPELKPGLDFGWFKACASSKQSLSAQVQVFRPLACGPVLSGWHWKLPPVYPHHPEVMWPCAYHEQITFRQHGSAKKAPSTTQKWWKCVPWCACISSDKGALEQPICITSRCHQESGDDIWHHTEVAQTGSIWDVLGLWVQFGIQFRATPGHEPQTEPSYPSLC